MMGECIKFGRGTIQKWAPDSTFANNDWETIIRACQENVIPDNWKVGDKKPMTIKGTNYDINIIGKNHDIYSDGSGTAPLTFQLNKVYTGSTYKMNTTKTNVGGWKDSALRNTYLPQVMALMPSEVQAAIKEVNKLTSAGNKSTTITTTADKLFCLSEVEVYGRLFNSVSGEGSQYSFYPYRAEQVDAKGGNWWLRSPYKGAATTFCSVWSGGTYSTDNANTDNRICFAFCF